MSALHFIECRYGREHYFIERNANDMDRETTIRDIISGEIENPVRVLAVFAEEAFARDVTEDVFREIADRHVAEPCSRRVIELVEQHVGVRAANELTEEAA